MSQTDSNFHSQIQISLRIEESLWRFVVRLKGNILSVFHLMTPSPNDHIFVFNYLFAFTLTSRYKFKYKRE